MDAQRKLGPILDRMKTSMAKMQDIQDVIQHNVQIAQQIQQDEQQQNQQGVDGGDDDGSKATCNTTNTKSTIDTELTELPPLFIESKRQLKASMIRIKQKLTTLQYAEDDVEQADQRRFKLERHIMLQHLPTSTHSASPNSNGQMSSNSSHQQVYVQLAKEQRRSNELEKELAESRKELEACQLQLKTMSKQLLEYQIQAQDVQALQEAIQVYKQVQQKMEDELREARESKLPPSSIDTTSTTKTDEESLSQDELEYYKHQNEQQAQRIAELEQMLQQQNLQYPRSDLAKRGSFFAKVISKQSSQSP